MRAQHTAHSFPAFPIYSCAFVADDKLVAGGGGGASRSGVKNKLKLFRISESRTLDVLSELELEKDEDAPMSMTADPETKTIVCGINSTSAKLEKGENENCRKFSIGGGEHRFTQLGTHGTLSGGAEDYQRVTVLSPDARFLAVAGKYDLSLLSYDSLELLAQPLRVSNGEIYDATFSFSHLILVTSMNLLIYVLPGADSQPPQQGEQKGGGSTALPELRLLKAIDLPSIPGVPAESVATFRAARLHPVEGNILYTAINVTLPRRPNEKVAKKQSYALKWRVLFLSQDINTFRARVESLRKLREGGLTCLDVSPDGKLLAFGASDYSLSVLDSVTLAPLISILKAHEFPITTLRFNPASRLLVSGGVDSSLRVVTIPQNLGTQSWSYFIVILLAIIAFLIAVLIPRWTAKDA
ncbi:quinon protein alcohol dehydrogenase-like superfamily [Phlebopus sp. FC_14]|nr:quinon protein alcohol dehydrogenase-like superfamily [Phlebopus sp. FC_14]